MKKRTLTESKPSELLRRAVKDARAAEKMPGVRLNMAHWARLNAGKCEVCMAGAVMLGISKRDALRSGDCAYRFGEIRDEDGLYEKLDLIDDMRSGRCWPHFPPGNKAVAEAERLIANNYRYDVHRAPWRVYLKAARILEEAGL